MREIDYYVDEPSSKDMIDSGNEFATKRAKRTMIKEMLEDDDYTVEGALYDIFENIMGEKPVNDNGEIMTERQIAEWFADNIDFDTLNDNFGFDKVCMCDYCGKIADEGFRNTQTATFCCCEDCAENMWDDAFQPLQDDGVIEYREMYRE